MKKKVFFILIITIFFVSGCSLSPYKNSKYGEMVVDSWFNDKTLGEAHMKAENINEIVSRECSFVTNKLNKYAFKCKITYKEKGETVIPLSKNSVIEVYAIFIKEGGNKYDYRVYNSKYSNFDEVREDVNM